ncbi:hypothetical protein [Polyangium aurulentum]|uniref:hypothetical protein n=1 Tax=Polyangium aurulentum TaxID=2567896 RepID=UPI0010ADD381|nr:hypothetical protein [Polyangium aurulentum]
MRALLKPLAISLAAALCGCAQSPPGPPICSEPGTCAEGRTCVVGRCRPNGGAPAPVESRRLVLLPDAAAVVSSAGPSGGGDALPETLSLGRSASGSVSLLLHFAVPIAERGEVAAAFLILDPLAGAPQPGGAVPLQIARILDPWRPETVSWGRHPQLDLPEKAGAVGPSLLAPARIDVTHLVRLWAERRPDDHGIAVLADASDPFGATFSLGITEGKGPRLEVYVR